MKKDAYLNLGNDVINKKQFREFWLGFVNTYRTNVISLSDFNINESRLDYYLKAA
tara:strand:+ start:1115 stop:1279 length:165 start_codon:yes stop_codon:yes gene_type:complete